MDAVAKVGYVPNPAARTLRSRKSHMVLVVLPDISNIFFSQVLRGIEEALFDAGYGMVIGNLDGSPEKEVRLSVFAASGQVDGVLFLNGHLFRQNGKQARPAIKLSIPMVAVCEAIEDADIPQIEAANEVAACQMTKYLAGLGHEKIGYVCGPADNILERERFKGYQRGLEEMGRSPDPDFIWPGDYKLETGILVAERMEASRKRPTAIFCSNDEMAIGLTRGLATTGIRVPEDMSVAGFDDIEFAEMSSPPLTTIRQPRRELGRSGALTLLAMLRGEAPSHHIRLTTELIERASTAPLSKRSG